MTEILQIELDRKLGIWASLRKRAGSDGVSKALIREVGIYGGAQGIWIDKKRTAATSRSSNVEME